VVEEKIPKRNFHTTRPVGRPRTRWADVVQRDALQLLEIRGWKSKAAYRDKWRPRPGRGCSAVYGWMDCYPCVLITSGQGSVCAVVEEEGVNYVLAELGVQGKLDVELSTVVVAASVVWWLACWPLVPKIAGSNRAEAVRFFG
jgi:hypothetical protein